jgi:hypothetical protein
MTLGPPVRIATGVPDPGLVNETEALEPRCRERLVLELLKDLW